MKKTAPSTKVPQVKLAGSERTVMSAGSPSPLRNAEQVSVSVILRRKKTLSPKTVLCDRLTRAAYKAAYAADAADMKKVRTFAKDNGLTVDAAASSAERCTMVLKGSAAAMQKAFAVTLQQRTMDDGRKFRVRDGAVHLPQDLQGIVQAVLGLDNRPQALPHFRVQRNTTQPHAVGNAAALTSFTPTQLATVYQFPSTGAAGQTIGIIELGGGFRQKDITAYFKKLNIPTPTVTAVLVDGAKNSPTTSDGADGEVMLDIEVAAAVAPGAKIAVYFAPNTDQGFLDALTTAIHDSKNKPSVISISWGSAESNWTAQAMTAMDNACQSAALLGITVTAAAGDNGSSDGETGNANHVDFPSSSPHILACGGTKLTSNGTIFSSEAVWNESATNEGATGGGVSNVFALPTWQAKAGVPKSTTTTGGRGVPDIAGNADPATGYQVLVDGQNLIIGGTSAVAPLWAGLVAVLNKSLGKSVGLIQPKLYAAATKNSFHDVTQGDNGAFKAGAGWDACTGLGTPIGTALFKALGGSSATKKSIASVSKKKS